MNTVAVMLTCGCALRIGLVDKFPVHKVKDIIPDMPYCIYHGYNNVEKINDQEWHLKCFTCKYGRWVGQSKANGQRLKRNHHRAYPHHLVELVYDTVTKNGKGLLMTSSAAYFRSLAPRVDSDAPPPF